MKKPHFFLLLLVAQMATAQIPDHVYKPGIKSVRLYRTGDVYSYPLMTLNGGSSLDLSFDDLEGGVKNFYYTFQLCNADWIPANIQTFDYIRGFTSTRITTYRNSSISLTKYTHYQATIPDRNSVPTKSGNYLLKVFRNNDTSNLYFTRRFLVVDNRVAIATQLKQPFSSQLFQSDQRIFIAVNTANGNINSLSPQDLKLVVLQNNSWPTAAHTDHPSVFRGNYYEYNDDLTSFQSGREWRWIDLRSLRLMSDRMQKLDDNTNQTHVYVKPDGERRNQVYIFYRDLNGVYTIENTDGNNPDYQSDYAYTHFTFNPPGGRAYPGKDLYIYGDMTNFTPDDSSKMVFNPDKGVYEKTLFLKQGYYNYSYITTDTDKPMGNRFGLENTEGNFNSTENNYTILVYYRQFGGRADELIGYSTMNSLGR